MTSPNSAYAAAVLAIYLVLFFPAMCTAWKHGGRGLAWIGWGYLVVFCLLRITGSALQIADGGSSTAAIISSVGLSPLTIAAAGILHEGRFYLFCQRRPCDTEAHKIETILILVFHILVAAAIALLAVGASSLASAKVQADPAALNRNWHLAGGGALLLLLTLLLLCGAALFTYSNKGSDHGSATTRYARRLVLAVVITSPILAIRVLGVVVYFFGQKTDMNPSTGTWGYRVGLYLMPELLAAVTLLAGGLATRELRRCAEGEEEVVDERRGGRGRDGYAMKTKQVGV